MRLYNTISDVRAFSIDVRAAQKRLALVPTMGALHEGHKALVRRAQQASDVVIVSIFVNPLQFGDHEDLSQYPRDLEADMALLESWETDAVFAPTVTEMYPDGPSLTRVTVEPLSHVLCGQTRPTHFQGVSTVVAKLFHIMSPDSAVFGEKDWQQLAVIRRMVRDLNMPIAILGEPTVRESSGLAISSRNRYLTAEQKCQAAAIYRALQAADQLYAEGERQRERLSQIVRYHLMDSGIESEYVELADPNSLVPAPETLSGEILLAVAVRLGKARLIDNVILGKRRSWGLYMNETNSQHQR